MNPETIDKTERDRGVISEYSLKLFSDEDSGFIRGKTSSAISSVVLVKPSLNRQGLFSFNIR